MLLLSICNFIAQANSATSAPKQTQRDPVAGLYPFRVKLLLMLAVRLKPNNKRRSAALGHAEKSRDDGAGNAWLGGLARGLGYCTAACCLWGHAWLLLFFFVPRPVWSATGKWVCHRHPQGCRLGMANCATYRPRTQPFCEPQLLQNKTPLSTVSTGCFGYSPDELAALQPQPAGQAGLRFLFISNHPPVQPTSLPYSPIWLVIIFLSGRFLASATTRLVFLLDSWPRHSILDACSDLRHPPLPADDPENNNKIPGHLISSTALPNRAENRQLQQNTTKQNTQWSTLGDSCVCWCRSC